MNDEKIAHMTLSEIINLLHDLANEIEMRIMELQVQGVLNGIQDEPTH